MVGMKKFIRKERLYILLLVFVILINIAVLTTGKDDHARVKPGKAKIPAYQLQPSRQDVERIFKEKKYLAVLFSLAMLLIAAIFFLGVLVDTILASMKFAGNEPAIRTGDPGRVRWNLWDVYKVSILFLFFGHMTVLIESALVRVFPVLNNNNFRMILNSSVLDTIGIVFILYFTIGQYKERLISLGLTFRNFFKNVFYGVVAYVAAVPILIVVLVIIGVAVSVFKYVPERQPVVELFLREKDPTFLFYTSIFAAFVGPIIEELFFRAFMYQAFKKYVGVFWAVMVTSVFFAALHAHLIGFLPIMILGIVLCYVYEKTGSIVSSITVHTIHNLSMVFLVFLVKQLMG